MSSTATGSGSLQVAATQITSAPGAAIRVMARLYDPDGLLLVPSNVSDWSYSVLEHSLSVAGGGGSDSTDVLFPSLQTDAKWTKDTLGYNFSVLIPASVGALLVHGHGYTLAFGFDTPGDSFGSTYQAIVSNVPYGVDETINPQQKMSLFLPHGETPANGWPYVIWVEGQGYLQGTQKTSIDSGVEVLWPALNAGIAVVSGTATYMNQAIHGHGKIFPPLGSTLANFKNGHHGYKDACLMVQKARLRSLADEPYWNTLDPTRCGIGGRSGGGHMSAFAGLSMNRDAAVDASWATTFHAGASTRPNFLVLVSVHAWWNSYVQSNAGLPAGTFFNSTDTDFDGAPAAVTLADVALQHQAHASPLRYGFDFASYTGLGASAATNINRTMPVIITASALEASPPLAADLDDGFTDGAYHGAYLANFIADPHSVNHALMLTKAIRELPGGGTATLLLGDAALAGYSALGVTVDGYFSSTADMGAQIITFIQSKVEVVAPVVGNGTDFGTLAFEVGLRV